MKQSHLKSNIRYKNSGSGSVYLINGSFILNSKLDSMNELLFATTQIKQQKNV